MEEVRLPTPEIYHCYLKSIFLICCQSAFYFRYGSNYLIADTVIDNKENEIDSIRLQECFLKIGRVGN